MNKMKKNVLPAKECDFYSFYLPFSVLKKNSLRKEALKELEKRHPRFSARFLPKLKYRLNKKGIAVEAAVVDKLKLAECIKKNPGKRVFLGSTDLSVSCNYGSGKNSGKSFFIILMLAAVFSIMVFIAGKNKNSESKFEEQKEVVLEKKLLPSARETAELILSRVYEKNGRVTKFSWLKGECMFFIEECFPEEVVFDKACSVSYKNGEPSFSAGFRVQEEKNSVEKSLGIQDFQVLMRNSLNQCGAVIFTEKLALDFSEMNFFVSGENFKRSLESCLNTLNKCLWHEEMIVIDCKENGFNLTVQFMPGIKPDSSVLEIISSYENIFRPNIVKLDMAKAMRKTVQKIPILDLGREKLGQIKKNGAVYIFYKNMEGKIILERQQ